MHAQLVEVCGCLIGFVCVGPGLNEFFFKIIVNCSIWSGRGGDGQNPVLRTSLPLVDIRAIHVGEGVGDLLPWIHHDRVCGVYELIETKFVEEVVGPLSVPFEDRGLFPLEWFVTPLDWVRSLR